MLWLAVCCLALGLGAPWAAVRAGPVEDATLAGMPPAPEFRCLYISGWSSGFESAAATAAMVNYAAACHLNAIVPQVRLRADAYYASTIEPPGTGVAAAPGYDPLGDCIARAHALGMEVHPWVVTFRVWTTTAGPGHTTPEHIWWTHGPGNTDPAQDWLMYSDTGAWDYGGTVNLDPGHPAVEDYLIRVFLDIVSRYDVDGLILDYIRYPAVNWGYNPVAVARFNAQYGRTGNPPASDATWQDWRREQVTNLVRRLYLEIKAVKPWVKLGADVWNAWSTGNASYLQDWDGWMRNHWLDLAQPMMYTSNNNLFRGWLDDALTRQYGRHVYPLVYAAYDVQANVLPQVGWVQERAFPGLGLYAYGAIPDRAALQSALLAGPFASAVPTPDMPWLSAPTLGMLKGRVVDGRGQPVDGAMVSVQGRSTRSSGTGFYGFVDLEPGAHTVQASAVGYDPASAAVTLYAGQVATLDLTLQKETTPPSTPANLVATPLSGRRVHLTWSAATDNVGVSGYRVYRDGAAIGTSPVPSYEDATCRPATTYRYEVSAYDAAGNESPRSAAVVVTTPEEISIYLPLAVRGR